MEGKIRNLYPGGNTPNGFYSYYNYILPQKKAEKIFCLKGGPGVGKSTLMRKIGQRFVDSGEEVDFFWCSSDPSSLDGILIRGKNAAIVDGTSPHLIDPKNPMAVDEIINLGDFLDEKTISENKKEIIKYSEMISRIFGYAYGYLKCAGQQYDFMAEILDHLISYSKIREYRNQLQLKLDGISIIRRAESKSKMDSILGKEPILGERRRFFAGAITPDGIKNSIASVVKGTEKIISVNVPVGFRTDRLLKPVADRLTDAGFDIEEYYCPMSPENKLEHIVCRQASVAVVCCNENHTIEDDSISGKIIKITVEVNDNTYEDKMVITMLEDMRESGRKNILNAVEILKKAKEHHDILENYYAPNMDFEKVRDVESYIIGKIENI